MSKTLMVGWILLILSSFILIDGERGKWKLCKLISERIEINLSMNRDSAIIQTISNLKKELEASSLDDATLKSKIINYYNKLDSVYLDLKDDGTFSALISENANENLKKITGKYYFNKKQGELRLEKIGEDYVMKYTLKNDTLSIWLYDDINYVMIKSKR